MNVPIIIPALRPGPQLTALVEQLSNSEVRAIVIVDDGSGDESRDIFDACSRLPKVHILRHTANLGKGAAIKTGIRFVLDSFRDSAGVVTADADGQHHLEDILGVAQSLERNPECLILGSRQFDRSMPARNRIGNVLSRALVRVVLGQSLRDTQTGLRGIPGGLLPFLLELRSNGYEFELDMLIACKHHVCPIVEQTIQTIYAAESYTSHFDPLHDSMRISFVLFRFSTLSLLTAVVDNLVFFIAYRSTASILASQAMGRLVAVLFNYGLARRAVFLSRQRHRTVFPRYILLVICSGAVSYGLIRLLTHELGMNAILAKVSAELLLFIANFALQRDFVFTRQGEHGATDWTRYYRSVPVTARLTRKYTARVLIAALKSFRLRDTSGGVIVELGGANSCFLDRIVAELRPSAYYVVDMNDYGLSLLHERSEGPSEIRLHRQDVLHMDLEVQADTVFSIGLIEHFDPAGTRTAILKHFDLLKPDGCAILSFPTPTWVYRAARSVIELLGMWNFPDERPLSRREVLECIPAESEVLLEKTLWPLVLTQHMMVIRKPAR
jgi:glycosyltransferase involved in cell wall biosynthesis